MKKIETILQFLEKSGIKPATFEREMEAGNGYLDKTVKRGSDVSYKFIEKLRQNKPEWYEEMFGDIEKGHLKRSDSLLDREDRLIWAIASITKLSEEVVKLQSAIYGRDVVDCVRELDRSIKMLIQRLKDGDTLS